MAAAAISNQCSEKSVGSAARAARLQPCMHIGGVHAALQWRSGSCVPLQEGSAGCLRRFAASADWTCRDGRDAAVEGSGKGFGSVPVMPASILHSCDAHPRTCPLYAHSAKNLQLCVHCIAMDVVRVAKDALFVLSGTVCSVSTC